MPAPDKPRHRSGYLAEDLELVRSVCLTVAVTLGAYLDDLSIVGGLVPSLLIDQRTGPPEDTDPHPGTNDLDIGLAIALLDEERYAELADRLRQEGFGPDTNEKGNPTVQRWRLGDLKITIDFLMPPLPDQGDGLRVQALEPDLGALVTPGLELAFDERVHVELTGTTLFGERVTRTVPVCGPAAFIVLKSLAFADRGEPKDAYDLLYVLRAAEGGATAVADRLVEHAAAHREIVVRALRLLERDFNTPDDLGPRRAASFEVVETADLDAAVADAHGYVDDLLGACRERELLDG